MSWHREDHTVAISGGVGTFTTDHPWRGTLWNLIIEPDTGTTTWVLNVLDRKGDSAISFTDTGSTNEALETPVLGPYTFSFSAVSADEDIRVRATVKDTSNY
jgi:hypothetical protein